MPVVDSDFDFDYDQLISDMETNQVSVDSVEKPLETSLETKVDEVIQDEVPEINEPHLILKKELLIKHLEKLNSIIVTNGEIISRTVRIQVVNNKVQFSYSCQDIVGTFEIPIINDSNRIESTYLIEFKPLLVTVKNSESYVIFTTSNDTLAVKVLNGTVDLDNYQGLDSNKFNIDQSQFPNKKTFDKESLKNTFSISRILEKQALRTEEKKISVQENTWFLNFSMLKVKLNNTNIDNLVLRFIDVNYLNNLDFETLEIYENVNSLSYLFKDKDNLIIVPKISSKDTEHISKIFNKVDIKNYYDLDLIQFYKKLSVIKDLVGTGATLTISTINNKMRISTINDNRKPIFFDIDDMNFIDSISIRMSLTSLLSCGKLVLPYKTIKLGVTKDNKLTMVTPEFVLLFSILI